MRKTSAKIHAHQLYASHPWRSEPCSGGSEISVFVEKSGRWETIALVKKTSGASAEAGASYIAGLVNGLHAEGNLLDEARTALEAITSEGLNFSTEQNADIVIQRLKSRNAIREP